jgi:ketosteroid isomerase-like protein
VKFRSLAEGAKAMAFTRTSRWKDEVRGYFAGLTSEWEMLSYTIDEYIAQSDRIVAVGNCAFKHKKTGKILEALKADFHKFRAGKICEFLEFYDTAKALGVAAQR